MRTSTGGAQEKTRTSTTLLPQVPETCASTNSATWAFPHATGNRAEISRTPGDVNRRRGILRGAADDRDAFPPRRLGQILVERREVEPLTQRQLEIGGIVHREAIPPGEGH